ncbi:hypothetical protein Tco_1554157 [Tanacetum coccineum]
MKHLEEYEDDETEDGPVDYPIEGGDNGDDDDGDSSGDDTDEDEDDEDEDDKEEEEHIAPADSTIAAPIDEPVFPPEGTEPVIPPPQTSISPLLEAEIERLLAMTTPSPSLPILLSPPYAGERLARCTAPPAHSSPLLPSSRSAEGKYLEISPMRGEYYTRSHDMQSSHEHDTQDLYSLLEDAQNRGLVYHSESIWTRSGMSDMQAELLALREQQRRARQPGPEARILDHQDASGDADSHI